MLSRPTHITIYEEI